MNGTKFTLAELLRTSRRRIKGLSQRKLAKKIGVHFSTISRWERNEQTEEISIRHLRMIGKITKTPAEEFIELSGGNYAN